MSYLPRRPTGSTPEALFDQAVWDNVFGPASKLNNSSTVSVRKTSQGFFFKAFPPGATGGAVDIFPFKIYVAQANQIPDDPDNPPDPEDAPRTFLVRQGQYGNIVVTGDGMDGYNTDPDSSFFPVVGAAGQPLVPIVVPEDAADGYYFWIEVTTDGAVLRTGEDPTDNPDAINQWTDYPENDGLHIMIGFVEIDPNEDGGTTVTVRQFLRYDILPYMLIAGCDPTGKSMTYRIAATVEPPDDEDDD